MRTTKRKPVTVGEMLKEEFLEPMRMTSEALAEAMGEQPNTVCDLLNGKALTETNALKLALVFGTTTEFWMNIQHAVDNWETSKKL